MASVVINTQDLVAADRFLTQYLQENIPDADFSVGSANRDFTINAMAYIVAYLQKEMQTIRDRRSLLALAHMPADEDVDEMADAILSNWFLRRKSGQKARTVATVHVSRAADTPLPPSTRFSRSGTVFVPDYPTTVMLSASEFRPVTGADGVILDYTIDIPLVAVSEGAAGNIPPGRFSGVDTFSPYFLYAENVSEAVDGKDKESTAGFLERAPTAISTRNLSNARAIDAVLRDRFATDHILVVGMGEPEMRRDLSSEDVTGLRMHVGGHYDVYANLARTEVVETHPIGGTFTRPDGTINVLRDESGIDFTASVKRGDVLRVVDGLPAVPREFIVTAVRKDELEVGPNGAFSVATDETDPETFVKYTVGRLAPGFSDLVGATSPRPAGQTSRRSRIENGVMLRGRPQYAIRKVEVVDAQGNAELLDTRVNGVPARGQYQVVGLVPAVAQSARATTAIYVSPVYAGRSLKVTYDTLVGYDEIQTFVTDRFERIVCANGLVKGRHPVYIEANISVQGQGGVDADAISASVAAYVNNFPPGQVIDVSSVTRHIRTAFPQIVAIMGPVELSYKLLAPDGQVYAYQTRDLVSITPNPLGNSARLVNGLSLRDMIVGADLSPDAAPANAAVVVAANTKLRGQMLTLGVSDRTVRYLCRASDINVTQVL